MAKKSCDVDTQTTGIGGSLGPIMDVQRHVMLACMTRSVCVLTLYYNSHYT